MKTLGSLVVATACATLLGCSHESQTGSVSEPYTAQSQSVSTGCPVHGQSDVQATVSDMQDGVAITFSGQQRELDSLRATLRAMDEANASRGDAFASCPCIYERGAAASQPGSSYGSSPQSGYGSTPQSSYGGGPSSSYGGGPSSSYGGNPAYGAYGGSQEPMTGTQGQRPGSQGQSMMQPVAAVPAETSIEDTPTGGVLKLRAKDPSQLQALRDQVRQNVMAMQRGCVGSR
jgi:hypothetical protein